MFELQAEAKGIRFIFECHHPLPEVVRTDEKRLRQILINLLSNALKYTHRGKVIFSVGYRSQVAEFTVADSGQGIAGKDFERIFQPFERIREPGAVHIPGTGLGLTITRLLTDIMGGDLSFTSEPGVGSTFKLALFIPGQQQSSVRLVPEQTVRGFQGPAKTLLVVDDDPVHRGLVRDILTPLGFAVAEAEDGLACMELSKHYSADLFLLDISMPGIDGWELARQLRQSGCQQPIIMLSADASEGQQADTRSRSGIRLHDGYLVKPFRVSALLDVIGDQLDLRWLHDEPKQASERVDPAVVLNTLDIHQRRELLQLAVIGYARGIMTKLDQLEEQVPAAAAATEYLRRYAADFQFASIIRLLENSLQNFADKME